MLRSGALPESSDFLSPDFTDELRGSLVPLLLGAGAD
jgi:hypothetical protein